MTRLELDTDAGRLVCEAKDEAIAREVASVALEAAHSHAPISRAAELGGRAAWFKSSALRGAASARHTLRARLLAIPAPRMREAANLAWLRAHGFQAPEPLAAGTLERGGLLRFQFLATALVERATPLPGSFAQFSEHERTALASELGREAGRMHRLGFVHRDLLARNLLVASSAANLRLWFLDAWRGGPEHRMRGPDYDLGCLMLSGASLFAPSEQRVLFAAYFDARPELAAPARARLFERAARHRERLLRQIAREPHRWREPQPPAASWDWRALF